MARNNGIDIRYHRLGTIRGGFRMKDGSYANICPYWHEL